MPCAVEDCDSRRKRRENDEPLTFHLFPKEEKMKQIWLKMIQRSDYLKPSKQMHICSKHFTANSFQPNDQVKYRRLKPTAIPTLHLCYDPRINDGEPRAEVFPVYHFQAPRLNRNNPLQDSQESTAKTTATVATNCDLRFEVDDLKAKQKQMEIEIANYKNEIQILEKELEMVTKVSERRNRKINTLMKRNARSSTRNAQLYDIVWNKLNQKNIEHLALN